MLISRCASRKLLPIPRKPARIPARYSSTIPPSNVHPLARNSATPASNTWSTLAVVLLSTFVGTATYMIGLQSTPIGAPSTTEAKVKISKPSQETFKKALAKLKAALPEDCISADDDDLHSHSTSSWTYHKIKALHGVVVFPRNTEDVVAIVKIADEFRIPLVAHSGGTSLEGHFQAPEYDLHGRGHALGHSHSPKPQTTAEPPLPSGSSICIDFSANMNSIIKVNERDMDVIVQPGISYDALNDELKSKGLFFPVDPGPGAQIGGMVGTGCSGTNAVRYGTMRENVINLTVVLPNGEVIKTRQRAKKSSAGPDLSRLFIGSEGTLGLVVEATLKLAPILPHSVGVVSFPSVEAAVDTVADLVRTGVGLQCMELLDDLMMSCVNKANSGDKTKRVWAEKPSLFLKFQGDPEQIDHDVRKTSKIAAKHGGDKLLFASTEREKEDLWYARKAALWSVLDAYPGTRPWTTDVCVPMSLLPQLVAETKEDLLKTGLIAPILGHVGDGNFHAIIAFRDEQIKDVEDIVHRMVERAQRLDGTCTGEHGIGMGKIAYLEDELGPGTVKLLRKIKQEIDPKNIFNPGKLIAIP